MLPDLHTLWIEGALSNLERICLASMLEQDHKVMLHIYDKRRKWESPAPNSFIDWAMQKMQPDL